MGQALLGDEIHGVNFDEQWVSLDPDYDYDESVGQIREVIDSYPGLYRTVQTYLRERVKEVLSGSNESIVVRVFGPGRQGPREEGDGDRGEDGEGRRHHRRGRRADRADPADRGRGGRRGGAALRDHARPRAPAVLRAAGERGGRRHLPRRQGVRRARLDAARVPRQRHATSRTCRSTRPAASQVPLHSVADVRHQADREHDQARAPDAPGRRQRGRGGTRPGLHGRRRPRGAGRRSTCRPAITPRCSARRPS